ncbi:MAG TPA: putative glycoside hydrolase [Candidatus Kapabacteria bacterium]|nr:putative glycoside hydrolase [Candidatus Kapabacteria bacterium]
MNKGKLLLTILILGLFFFTHTSVFAAPNSFPKKANYYLRWSLTEADARELAKWDLVILDMEIQATRPDLLRKLREWNPNITLLVYITPQEIFTPDIAQYSQMRRILSGSIPEGWYLHSSQGNRLSFWPGTQILNVSESAPVVNGEQWNDYLPRFVSSQLLSTGLWDGVFYDNGWDFITYYAGSDIDANRDGVKDNVSLADEAARSGLNAIFEKTRQQSLGRHVVVNGTSRAFASTVNGMMVENVVPEGWGGMMEVYKYYDTTVRREPKLNILNANTRNVGTERDYQAMRFGLTSALLQDGYYSFDHGDKDHGQVWLYDEYAVRLGNPLRASVSRTGRTTYGPDIWTREFEHGLAVVNSGGNTQTVDLGGEYEKIHGTQDKVVNDGSIISETDIPANDGVVLLKTFSKLNDVLIPNGAFVRFLRPDGTRARNGIFVFEEGYKGGDQIAHVDIDGNGLRDLIVASGNKVSVWRDDGQLYTKLYPYTASYRGDLQMAVGDTNGDSAVEIYIGPSAGFSGPLKVYSRDGELLKDNWYPFGKTYKGGLSLAIANLEGTERQFLLVGGGKGIASKILVFNSVYASVRQWPVFEPKFRGGISVAAGDVDGNGLDEVVVGAGPGKTPLIRVFDPFGRQLYKEFVAYSTRGTPGIGVATLDVDFDGVDEILAISRDAVN